MKISKLFHWLYAVIMFLPLLVLPIFGIYARNESGVYNQSITLEKNMVVDFNQQSSFTYTIPVGGNNSVDIVGFVSSQNTLNHKFYCRSNLSYWQVWIDDLPFSSGWAISSTTATNLSFPTNPFVNTKGYMKIRNYPRTDYYDTYGNITLYLEVYDLTQMFGAGNEPTKAQFDEWYPTYNSYVLSRVELLKNVSTETFDDTDIGSQAIYTLYNTTDKYFNFNEFSLFSGLYDWVLVTFYAGNAPLGFMIFWQYLCYWLTISIFWLVFDLVMYLPLLTHKWIDKGVIS